MTLSPRQKAMIRRIASISSDLSRELWALSDRRQEKLDALRDAERELQEIINLRGHFDSVSNREAALPDALADEMAAKFPDRIKAIQEYIADLKHEFRQIEERQGSVNLDRAAANKLAEALIRHTGYRHEDFPARGTAGITHEPISLPANTPHFGR